MEEFVDNTAAVRPGEEFDLEAVGNYLKEAAPELSGDFTVEQFPSGHSNLTYMLKMGDQELVLRRPPFGTKVKSAHDMGREFKILTAIHQVYPPAPKPFVYCEDESIIGAKFYVMERRRGIIIRKQLPAGFPFPPETAARTSKALIKNLAEIHAIDYQAVGLGDFGKPDGFLQRQVEGWTKRYYGSQTHDFENVEATMKWLKENLPASPAPALIHNDYKYDNVVLDSEDLGKVVGVLDWEMSAIGDPLMDLGVTLGYWVQDDDPEELKNNSFGPTSYPGSPTRRELADYYAEVSGRELHNMPYYLCFATFKLAVVLQQIYYRFAKGHTNDERFGPLIDTVKLLFAVAASDVIFTLSVRDALRF